MQFRVPQFLDIEDKVFGPFTFKQFGYMLGAIAFMYIFWKLLPAYASMPLIIVVSGNFLALAFVEINGRKYGDVLEAAVKYFLGAKVFVWQKKQVPLRSSQYSEARLNERLLEQEKEKQKSGLVKKTGEIRHYSLDQIKDLSRKLDVLDDNTIAENKNLDLRSQLLKERNGFRL